MPSSSLSTAQIERLTESGSIALAQSIQFQPISTPLTATAITTSYICRGEGQPPLLLLPGFDSSILEFRRLWPLLTAVRETWAMDLLGFGFTERPLKSPFSPLAIKTHLYHFWQQTIDRPVVLVGASMGGAAAIDFALTYPDCVQRLVLIDSAGLAVGSPLAKYALLLPGLGYLATEFLRSPRVRQQISRNAYFDPALASEDAQACAALHLECPGWREALVYFTQSGGYGTFAQQLAHLQAPTLILWGQNDRILGTADAARFEQIIPDSKLIWIEQCGHVPHLEKPQIVAEQIFNWLDD